jgi:hypothetical protein
LVTKSEFKALQGGGDNQHGFGYADPGENAASNGTASYYGFNRPGMRFVSIDSVAEGGGDRGNLDDPQYRWLERELDRNSSRELAPGGSLRRDGDPARLIVVFGHHTLESMDNPSTDETAGACPAGGRGCDADPRPSTPIHQGASGPQPVRDLFLRYPNVIAYVAGHTHRSDVTPYGRAGRGLWEINTPSLVDPAQQLRTVEVIDNRDGTLSLFGTILDHSAPVRPPAPGGASSFTPRQMAALSRELSFNDPQVDPSEGLGQRSDRNVELLIDDPRSGALPAPRGRIVGTEGNDVINGTSGDDVIECGGGNDTVNAGAGDDIVRCGPGNDVVRGGSGHDSLFGQGGNDRLFGESGNDHHDLGPGDDRAAGGSGADTFAGVEQSVQD